MELQNLHDLFLNKQMEDDELSSTIGGGNSQGFWTAFSAINTVINHLLND